MLKVQSRLIVSFPTDLGIGGKLILESHKRANGLSHPSIVLLGHEDYYPRFGYKKCSEFNIKFPFEAPEENSLVIELVPGSLKGISGNVQYPKEFFE